MGTPVATRKLVGLALLILAIGSLLWMASVVVPLARYNQRSQRINGKINSLELRRPANVSVESWRNCIAWASIAHCNICFSEEHTTYEAMCRFEEQLDNKLKGDVDQNTIAWIGDRLTETGPHGQQYMTKWWEQWKATLQQADPKNDREDSP
jgi:hypothetical protein